MKKSDKYVSVVDQVVAGYSKQKKEREEKAKKTIEDFKFLTKHYGVGNTPNIPNAIKPKVADFLKGLQPLSDQDLHFKEYVRVFLMSYSKINMQLNFYLNI